MRDFYHQVGLKAGLRVNIRNGYPVDSSVDFMVKSGKLFLIAFYAHHEDFA